jgi:hypothetical protein
MEGAAASTLLEGGQLLIRASGVITIGVLGGKAVVFLMKTYVDHENARNIREANELADRNAAKLREAIAEEGKRVYQLKQEADRYSRLVFDYRRPGGTSRDASAPSFPFLRRDLCRRFLEDLSSPRVQAPAAIGAGASPR